MLLVLLYSFYSFILEQAIVIESQFLELFPLNKGTYRKIKILLIDTLFSNSMPSYALIFWICWILKRLIMQFSVIYFCSLAWCDLLEFCVSEVKSFSCVQCEDCFCFGMTSWTIVHNLLFTMLAAFIASIHSLQCISHYYYMNVHILMWSMYLEYTKKNSTFFKYEFLSLYGKILCSENVILKKYARNVLALFGRYVNLIKYKSYMIQDTWFHHYNSVNCLMA